MWFRVWKKEEKWHTEDADLLSRVLGLGDREEEFSHAKAQRINPRQPSSNLSLVHTQSSKPRPLLNKIRGNLLNPRPLCAIFLLFSYPIP